MGVPKVTPITETRHSWGFMVWDPSDGITTREQIILASGNGVMTAGAVLGVIGGGVAVAGGSNTGNGTFGAIAELPGAPDGAYTATCTQATTGTGAATTQKHEANVGTSTFGTITVAPPAQLGEYRLELTATGSTAAFDVFTPAGQLLGTGLIGTAFSAGGLGFTVTAGGSPTSGDSYDIIVSDNGAALFSLTDPNGNVLPPVTVGAAYAHELDFTLSQGTVKFVVGDTFTITAAEATDTYAPWDPTASNGLQFAKAVLGSYRKDTTSAAQKAGALVRGPSRVNASELIWGANVTTMAQVNTALAQLAARGIQSTLGTVAIVP